MEYSLSTSIKKLTAENKPKVGLLQGHGETPLNALAQVLQSLMVLYEVEPVNLDEVSVNASSYKTLVIINPTDSFPPAHLAKLDEFLAAGKNICIAMNRVDGNLQTTSGTEIRTGLERWLESRGVKVNPNFILDQNCGSVTVNQQQGYMTYQSNMRFPYLPLITKFAPHPVTKGLSSVLLQFASSIDFTATGSDISFTPLAMTSERSGMENAPLTFNISRNWQQQDFPRSGLTVAALVAGKLAGGMNSRMIIISDGDFPVNGAGQQARQIPPDNLNLMVNSVDWLSDDTGLIDLRTREVTSRPLDQMDDGKKAMLKYINFLLPILLILGIGFFRYQSRRNLRFRRMNENYI
jgi:gliding-associated putative ABC transporter substrate-binding component GldG